MSINYYEIRRIPDLTLNKYSSLEGNGVEGVLKKQLVFLRQIHRNALWNNETIHWIYEYNPDSEKGKRLKIFLAFDNPKDNSLANIWIENSSLAPYYDIVRVVPEEQIPTDLNCNIKYKNMSILIKQEKFAKADKEEYGSFYSVNKWGMNEDARLFNLYTMMQNMNQPCVYCVDLKPVDMTNTIEEPENLGNVMLGLREILTLRIQNNSNGLTSFQKDESADYTLERYKGLIKEIAANPQFQANIRVYSNNEEYSNMLLSAAASEALSEGAHDVKSISGEYNIVDIINHRVETICDDKAPNELSFWPTFFMMQEIAPFVAFPALYSGESIEMPKETAPKHDSNGLYLGRDNDGYSVYIPVKNLVKHTFIAGVPGSGKTNSMLHIATTLYHDFKIPFLIFEPVKQEYRALVNREEMKGVTVFSPSSGTKFLLHINPFEFPKKISLAEHIQNLINVFDGSFSMDPPMPFLLDRAIERVYRDKGWLPYMINDGTMPYPTMSDLYIALEKILDETDYEGDIKGNLKSILQVRIGSLLSREMGEVFDVGESTIAPDEWLSRAVVIELEAMGSGPANFLTLILSTLIRESLKATPLREKGDGKIDDKHPRHVIFFEEAHNLIGSKAEKDPGENTNSKIAATAFIVKMLAEVRALGEAIIIADQLPTAMASEILKNTSLKIGHRIVSQDDRVLLGSTMSADEGQLERMATFTQGKTLAVYEGLLKPFELQMHQWSKVKTVEEGEETIIVNDKLYNSPTDNELYELLSYEGSPFIKDMEKSLSITLGKYNNTWIVILKKINEYFDSLDVLVENCAIVEESREHLEHVNWEKLTKEKNEEVLAEFEKLEQDIKDAEFRFNSLCDEMEEVIFGLYSYKKQNLYFSEQVKEDTYKKMLQFKDFCSTVKERFCFERTKEQRDRRTKILKMLE